MEDSPPVLSHLMVEAGEASCLDTEELSENGAKELSCVCGLCAELAGNKEHCAG